MTEEVEKPNGKKTGAIVAIVALVVIIGIAVFVYSVLPGIRASTPYELTPTAQVDAAASTALLACEVETETGETITLGEISSKSGKPIVLNVWASWCTHCDTEMADYQKLYDEYGDKVEFVMLNLNDTAGEPAAAREYIEKGGYTFPIYFDVDGQVRTAMALVGVPTSAIVSANGDLVMVRSGEITYSAMKATIDNVLKS